MAKQENNVNVVYPKNMLDWNIDDAREQILKAVESVKTVKRKVQVAAVAVTIIAEQAKRSGTEEDQEAVVQLAIDMVEELGDGIQSKGLIKWFNMFTFQHNDGSDKFTGIKAADTIKEKFDRAKKEHWYTKSPKKLFDGWNFVKEIERVIAQAEKMQKREAKKDDKGKVEVNAESIAVLKKLIHGQAVEAKDAIAFLELVA